MIQFLQQEIQNLKPYKHKVLHEGAVRDDLNTHHQQLETIVNTTKESIALEELQIEEELDGLILQKITKKRQLQEKEKQLKMVLLQKSKLMRECEVNQLKLQKNRQNYNELQTKRSANTLEKEKMMREIRENQIICQRATLENQQLRRRCEEQIRIVTSETINKQTSSTEDIIRHNIQQNITIISKLINLTQPLQQNNQRLTTFDKKSDQLRIIELTKQIQRQNSQNFMLKSQLKCEQTKYFQLSAKVDLLSKDCQVRQVLTNTFDKQEEQLQTQINKQRAKREELYSKLSQYKRLRIQLQQMYGNLSANYNSCKYSDLYGIKEMNKNSHKMERNISHQRHFLIERYSIIDNYRKYLRNN